MPDTRIILLALLGVLAIGFVLTWRRLLLRQRSHLASPGSAAADQPPASAGSMAEHLGIGFLTNFFDTLGIGSFAPTTAIYKLRRLVADERIPGTLNVGHTLPVVVQAFIFISIVEVDPFTLVAMFLAAMAGAWLGAGVVARLPRRAIQAGLGCVLLAAALFFTMKNFELFPAGGEATGLSGWPLAAAVAANFVLGALGTLGLGLYAPCMVVVYLLGMSPRVAYPIMMGSCAFLMPVGSLRFLRAQRYSLLPALGLTLGGLPAVVLAAWLVKSLPITTLRWVVTAVILYTALAMLRSARRKAG